MLPLVRFNCLRQVTGQFPVIKRMSGLCIAIQVQQKDIAITRFRQSTSKPRRNGGYPHVLTATRDSNELRLVRITFKMNQGAIAKSVDIITQWMIDGPRLF